MPVSKEVKQAQNRRAYLKRKSKQLGVEPETLEDKEDDNIAPIQPVSTPKPPSPKPEIEYEEEEITLEELNAFREWRKMKEDIKKKAGGDASYIFPILKSMGLALAPAMIGVFQRAITKTIEQTKNEDQPVQSQTGINQFKDNGTQQLDLLSPPKF